MEPSNREPFKAKDPVIFFVLTISLILAMILSPLSTALALTRNQSCEKTLASLTSEEAQAIQLYTGNEYYEPINSFLRFGKVKRGSVSKREVLTTIESLKSALAKLPDFEGRLLRFLTIGAQRKSMPKRFPWFEGTILNLPKIREFIDQYKSGATFKERAFMSTTLNDVGSGKFEFTTIQYRIYSRHGKLVSGLSNYGSAENEVLFLPDSRFKTSKVSGAFVDLTNTSNESEYPNVDQWVQYVEFFREFYPKVSQATVRKKFLQGKIPNIVIQLEEEK